MLKFENVEDYSNWGHWDKLHGIIIKEGDVVDVKVPDGTLMQNVLVHTAKTERDGIPTFRSYINAKIGGAKVRVYLLNSGIKARRISG
jgi:hypothetical protein